MTDRALYPSYTIVLVDDEEIFLQSASYAMRREGITNIEMISDSRFVLERLGRGGCGILLLDMTMPYLSGQELLEKVAHEYPDVAVFMVTAVNDVHTAVNCMKKGARDYILKPLQPDQFVTVVKRAIESRALLAEAAALKGALLNGTIKHPEAFAAIITNNSSMTNLFRYVEIISNTDLPILITGETGTGKELMAQAIHALSGRTGKFVSANIGGIDDTVMSDTLFGHVRGAFTGADQSRKGFIEEAAGGTLFLDEIGDLRVELQTKLLRLLQEGTFYPVGSDVVHSSSARIIAATNRDLRTMLQTKEFRHDLFYRLQAHEVKLPPLRDRLDDIRLLANAFVGEACEKFGIPPLYIPPELFTLLSTYSWPGNVRELKGLLFDAVSRIDSTTLSLHYLKEKLRELHGISSDAVKNVSSASGPPNKTVIFSTSLPTANEMELMLIQEALRRTNENKTQAADLLGITRATIIKRSKELE
jgi:DNA-binding NtrC family response regulator